jgi:predicted TIM-barrel fold metal-dependent hydrolase
MKYFDCHLHLPTPDTNGLDQLLRYLDAARDMVGGNLILNTRKEVDFAYTHVKLFPSMLNLIPYFEEAMDFPAEFVKSGWYKVHPRIQRLKESAIQSICQSLRELVEPPKGIIVHCFPWGPELQFNISLPLVIELARALPQTQVLVAHGGGYESWGFRAHTGMLKNVVYDFSVTMSYYRGSDILGPFQRYLQYSPDRIVFGSDWPSAQSEEQLSECLRLANEIEITQEQLELIFLMNAGRLWPENKAGTDQ